MGGAAFAAARNGGFVFDVSVSERLFRFDAGGERLETGARVLIDRALSARPITKYSSLPA